MSSEVYRILEKLATLVVRALYDDEAVVVMDMLIRDRYVRDSDMGSHLELPTKQVRKILQRLQAERLVDTEKASDDEHGHASIYWFINYRRFVGVVTLRLFRLRQILEERERQEQQRQNYTCPQCNGGFTSLEVQRLVNAGRKFCCSHCCPYDTHQVCGVDGTNSAYTLRETVFTGMDKAKLDLERFKQQLSCQENMHDGIFELLQELKEYEIPTNLPSENFKLGIGAGPSMPLPSTLDQDPGGKGGNNAGRPSQKPRRTDNSGQVVVVEIQRGDNADLLGTDDGYVNEVMNRNKRLLEDELADAKVQEIKKAKALPGFLAGSSIAGTAQNLENEDPSYAQISHSTNKMEDLAEREREYKRAFKEALQAQVISSGRIGDVAEIQIEVDKGGQEIYFEANRGGADMYSEESSVEDSDSESTDIAWYPGLSDDESAIPEIYVQVGTNPTQEIKIRDVTKKDIFQMTTEQFTRYYNLCNDSINSLSPTN